MPDEDPDLIKPGETAYRLELTAAQLKITYTALKSLLDDFGHDEHDVAKVVHEVLDKLPDEHAIRAIDLARELRDS
jgi:hypothetical protein